MKTKMEMECRVGKSLWRQSAVGLLLLTLLLVNPLQGLAQGMQYIGSTDYGVDLYGQFGPFIQNVTVTSGSYIDNLLDTPDAVDGYNHIWHLVNNGTIDGYYWGFGNGVYFDQGGSVNNNGNIYGSDNGIYITGDPGSVVNSSYIGGFGSDGIYFDQGGSVNNSGEIEGNDTGVYIHGGSGLVVNTGSDSIYGYDGAGVYMDQDGSVSNSGSIYGYYNGVYIGGPGYVDNNGLIAGGYDEGSSVVSSGVRPLDDGYGESLAGVYLNNGGVVINQTNGYIYGAYDAYYDYGGSGAGVYITGGLGYVTNAGTIYGNGDDGVELNNGGVVNNLAGGSIGGDIHGVDINGPATVINAGSINGNGGAGVYLNQGGTVDNQPGGSISGYNNGVEVFGAPGTVYNHGGSIVGQNGDGVYMDQGGTVVNKKTWSQEDGVTEASITGAVYGVEITGGAGYVTNSGYITGDSRDGVRLRDGGIVDNKRHGEIYGNVNGVHISSSAPVPTVASLDGGDPNGGEYTVINSGTITGYYRDGVLLENGGSVYNGRHGEIVGGRYGVEISNSIPVVLASTAPAKASYSDGSYYTVDNSGTITGYGRDGVRLRDGGTVYNSRHGEIYGNVDGVHISMPVLSLVTPNLASASFDDGSYTVYNSGTITGTNRDGVLLENGGSVSNGRHGEIWGGQNGVDISSPIFDVTPELTPASLVDGSYTVYNSGSITGNTNDGVLLENGGSVYNDKHGTIEGGQYGVEISGGPGVVVNSGTIIGDNGTAILLDSYSGNSVTLETHSDVEGNIVGGGTDDAAYLNGHGEYGNYEWGFTNFATLDVTNSGRKGWNLTGTNFFSTSATVEDNGLLKINGQLNSPYTYVNGTLGGSGVINGEVDIESYGTLSPGNSPGIITINGPLNFIGYSTYEVDVRPQTNDLTVVNGTATLQTNASVYVKLPFWYQWTSDMSIFGSNTVYTILTSTNLIGQFNSNVVFNTSMLFLTPSLLYVPTNNVYLDLRRKPFTSVARTFNQNGVAGALDGIVDLPKTPAMSNLVSKIFWMGSASEVQAALDSLSGEIHGTLGMLDVQQQDAFNNSIALRTGRMSAGGGNSGYASSLKPVQLADAGSTLPPMPQAEANQPWDIWLQGFGSFGCLDGDGNALGGDYTISGLSGGLDYRLRPELLVGLGGGYSQDDADVGGPGANGKVDAYQIAGYGGYVNGPWHLDGILSCGFLHTDTKRFINVGSIHQEADGSYDGGVFSLSAEGGYAFVYERLTIEPTLGLKYAHLWQDSFSETGTATDGHNYGLTVNSVDMDSFRTALGVRLAAQLGKKDGVQFIPALRAVWEHEFADRYADVNARFVGGSGDFVVRGVELGADSGVLGAGLTVAFNKTIQGFVNYDANLNSQLSSSTISGGLSLSW